MVEAIIPWALHENTEILLFFMWGIYVCVYMCVYICVCVLFFLAMDVCIYTKCIYKTHPTLLSVGFLSSASLSSLIGNPHQCYMKYGCSWQY